MTNNETLAKVLVALNNKVDLDGNNALPTSGGGGRLLNNREVKRYVVESYSNGRDFYNVYNDGFIEQGGTVGYTASANATTFSLLKPFTSQESYMLIVSSNTFAANWAAEANIRAVMVSNTQFAIQDGSNRPAAHASWYACGY